jgi:hypothetical protein
MMVIAAMNAAPTADERKKPSRAVAPAFSRMAMTL